MEEFKGFKLSRAVKAGQVVRKKTSVGRKRPNLSETDKADIIKRMRNFESPKSIAKSYGVDSHTINNVMNKRNK